MYSKILVGVDWSEASLKAARRAALLAKTLNAELTLITVVPPPTALLGELMTPELVDTTPLVDASRGRLEKLSKELSEEYGVASIYIDVVVGEPSDSIVDYALENGYNLIVLGKRRLSSLERFILGSITKKVVEKSPIDVLIITMGEA